MEFNFVKTNIGVAIAIIIVGINIFSPNLSLAQSSRASEIDRSATQALTILYKNRPGAKALGDKAVAVLIFPSIVKGGFIIAGQFGDGALRKGGKTVAYYRSLAASYGFQAGVQAFGYVLFFMDEGSVEYLDRSAGWETRDRTEPGRAGYGIRQDFVNDNAAEGRVCSYLRPEGTNGWNRYPGNQDHENQPVAERAQNDSYASLCRTARVNVLNRYASAQRKLRTSCL